MLKKLQQKFILINMILVGTVLLIGFCVVTTNTFNNQKENIDSALTRSVLNMENSAEYSNRPNLGGSDEGNQKKTIVPTLSVRIDGNGNYTSQGVAYMTFSELTKATKLAKEADSAVGKLSDMDLYYKKMTTVDNSLIVSFADSSALHRTMISLITYLILVFCSFMILLYLISLLLSKIVIKPVRKAWNQQQQFVADASHELKTPLTVILANNNILLSHQEDTVEEQSKWIESSQAEANHMKNLVDNLLYLARSDANKSKTIFSEVPLGEIAMDSALQFEPVAFEKGLELDYIGIDLDVKTQGDITKLKQLIHILIDNACKYGGEGSVVTISLMKVGNGVKKLSVHNEGNPINSKDLPHIFERFYRSDKARTQQNQEGGYGLGLAIAKSIVDEHNGKISVTSTEQDGTAFTVELKN